MNFPEVSVQPGDVAILGASGRFPGAFDLEQFWQNLHSGVESIRTFSDEELRQAGVDEALLRRPSYVKARGVIDQPEMFDAEFFGIPPREAEVMDPQHRLFLEKAWEVLEDGAHDPSRFAGRIGVFAGVGMSTYLLNHLYPNSALLGSVDGFQVLVGNDKDFVPSRVSYKLGLRGPSVNVNTACSSSLVAVHLAYQSLLTGECDLALAGGVSVGAPQEEGYLYQEGGITSPDGHCRAFADTARGTVRGFGVGVVLLKRLDEALADGDRIRAVLKGSAINNDGSAKAGYTAPGVDGQSEVVRDALALAGVTPRDVSYIEAHGTGTALGDAIEIEALRRVFGENPEGEAWCRLGSVKTNIGHLDAAAGVAGLIKTVLALEREELPPSLHFERPNPELELETSPFEVVARPTPWTAHERPRRAGVSAFGIGGTNAHVVVQEAPRRGSSGAARLPQLLTVSARSRRSLEAASENLAARLAARSNNAVDSPDRYLADVAFTLATGRRAFSHRRIVVARNLDHAVDALRGGGGLLQGVAPEDRNRPVAFLLPGQGAERAGMLRELWDAEPELRGRVEECLEVAEPKVAENLRELLVETPTDVTRERIHRTEWAQPSLFVTQWALAQWWMSRGVRPQALLGHSLGEYLAACLAGVFRLEDALALVVARGRLMQSTSPGAMLSVALKVDDLEPRLPPGVEVAAVNAPDRVTVTGSREALEVLVHGLEEDGVEVRWTPAERAFHSVRMEPILEAFRAEVEDRPRAEPEVPFVSNVTGTWISPAEATSVEYWVDHLRSPVRFADGATRLAENKRILLEIGPGRTLGGFVRRALPGCQAVASWPAGNGRDDVVVGSAELLEALGRVWLAGGSVEWPAVWAGAERRRVGLPTYPFERKRFWIDRPQAGSDAPASRGPGTARSVSEAARAPALGDSWIVVPGQIEAAATPVESMVRSIAADGRTPWMALLGPPMELEAAPPSPFPVVMEDHQELIREIRVRASRDITIESPPEGVVERFDELCAHHVCAYLENAGVEIVPGAEESREHLLERLEVIPEFYKFFDYLLGVLEEDGYLRRDGDRLRFERSGTGSQVEPFHGALVERHPELAEEAELLQRCVAEYPRALTGEIDAVSVLFPGGSSEAMKPVQERSARFSNFPRIRRVAAEVVQEIVRRAGGKRLRVLEVGAGDGNLTWEVVSGLVGHEVEYHFTDLGNSFVIGGQRRARRLGYDFMRFGVLDISRDPEAQGYDLYSFDLVLAFNVVHATESIRETLDHLRRLLVPRGAMFLLEASHVPRPGTLIWGLAEGYWYFSDTDLRQRGPMLPPAQWDQLLADMDFAGHHVYPEDPAAREDVDTALIVTQEPEEPRGEEYPRWLEARRRRLEESRRSQRDRLRQLGAEVVEIERAPSTPLATALAQARDSLDVAGSQNAPGIAYVARSSSPEATTARRLARHVQDLKTLQAVSMEQRPSQILIFGPPAEPATADELALAGVLDAFATSAERRGDVPWRHLRWEPENPRAGAEALSRGRGEPPDEGEGATRKYTETAPMDVSHPRPDLPTPYQAPRDEVEKRIVEIWQQAFGVAPVGIHDGFFDLGGDSILVTQVLSRVRDALGVEMPVQDFYERPTVAAMAETVSARGAGNGAPTAEEAESVEEPEIAPVSRDAYRARRTTAGDLSMEQDPGEAPEAKGGTSP